MCSNLENHNRNDDFRHNNINNNNNNNNNSNNDNNNNSSDDNNTNVLFMSYNDIYIYRILPFEELLRLVVGSKEVLYSALRIFIGSTSAIMVR